MNTYYSVWIKEIYSDEFLYFNFVKYLNYMDNPAPATPSVSFPGLSLYESVNNGYSSRGEAINALRHLKNIVENSDVWYASNCHYSTAYVYFIGKKFTYGIKLNIFETLDDLSNSENLSSDRILTI